MLETLISSKTRTKLLLRFFLNAESRGYLRVLASEFGESTNSIRIELNRLEKAGLLNSSKDGNKKFFKANVEHPLFEDIHSIVLKHIGFDKIIRVIEKLGGLSKVILVGSFAKGLNSNIIDLVFVGENINKEYLFSLIDKAENLIHRKIRFILVSKEEVRSLLIENDKKNYLVLWEKR